MSKVTFEERVLRIRNRSHFFLLNNVKLKTSGTITRTKLAYRIIIFINEIGFWLTIATRFRVVYSSLNTIFIYITNTQTVVITTITKQYKWTKNTEEGEVFEVFHDGWFWLVKANKISPSLVNYSHQKVLLKSKLILCHGSELRQNQEALLEKR